MSRERDNGSGELGDQDTEPVEVEEEQDPWQRDQDMAVTRQFVRPDRIEERLGDQRYLEKYELGRGGEGRTLCVRDRLLRRDVAMKVMERSSPQARRRFMAEAQAACQLEHPNIMPIYDLGSRSDGSLYYTMMLVDAHTLGEVFKALNQGRRDAEESYGLRRLLEVIIQVGRALSFAHSKGVVHRDLTPSNIMLGEFGEVLVTDWGMAAVRGKDVAVEEDAEHRPVKGETFGTPRYMSPEQARGEVEAIDEKSDIYSLGAILFEAMALRPSVKGGSPRAMMEAISRGERRTLSEACTHGRWKLWPELEAVCERAMAMEREERYGQLQEMVEDLESFSGGTRRRRAEEAMEKGRRAVERYLDHGSRLERTEEGIENRRAELNPWDGLEQKRSLWRLEDQREALRIERAHAFGEAIHYFQRSLVNDPEAEEALEEMAELYWHRYCEAEERGDGFDSMYYSLRLRQLGLEKYEQRLSRQVELSLRSRPSGAEVRVFRFEELDRRLVVSEARELGETPVVCDDLRVGSHLAVLQGEGRGTVRVPLYARRAERVEREIGLPPKEEVEPGFIYVAGGPYLSGGDREALNPRTLKTREVSPFFCAEFPVTFREYLAFLDDLPPGDARRRCPQSDSGDALWASYSEDSGRWKPRVPGEDDARRQETLSEQAPQWSYPVVGIRASDALAYCRWRSEREGRDYRLLTGREWEKAGRGVDGRDFPWGDHFDATFCKVRESRPGALKMEPVGTFVDDVSPYGIRDMAGGVQEWCMPADDERFEIRGGAWTKGERRSRLASRGHADGARRSHTIGFRVAYDSAVEARLEETQLVKRPQ